MEMILSVSEISGAIKKLVEETFESVKVIGEISNFKPHVSGHWYFTLKDENSQINCTMWRGINNLVFFTPQDGMKVVVSGKISIYSPRGTYQIDVRSMKPAGEGELQQAFEKMKQKLYNEGLFDDKFKKTIPEMPENIGIITAIDGAALRDMISVASRRYPAVNLYPIATKVQGEGAAEDIAANIRYLNYRQEELNLDLIILARGGGSIEDLWAFNEEVVARAIFESQIPIISGVGHEIDFTIADFVSDLRAPTPSAAMEIATPDLQEIFGYINYFDEISGRLLDSKITRMKNELKVITNSYAFRMPENSVKSKMQLLDNIFYKFENEFSNYYNNLNKKLELICSKVNLYDYNKILKKGFVLLRQENKIIGRASLLHFNKDIEIDFYDKKIEIKNYECQEKKL